MRCSEIFAARDPNRAQDASQRDSGRALNVVVETRQPVPIAIENGKRDVLMKVFPLQQCAGKDPFDTLDKGLDELVVGRAAKRRCR